MNNNMERNENDSIFDNIEPIDLTFVDTQEESDFIKDPSFNIFDNNFNNYNNINNQDLNYQNNTNEFNNMGLNDLVNKSIENINQEEKGNDFNNNSFDNFTNYNVSTSNESNELTESNNIFNSFDSNQTNIVESDTDSDIEIIDDYINQEDNSDILVSENSNETLQNDSQNNEFMDSNFTQNFESFNQANIDLTSTNNETNMFSNNEQVENNIDIVNPVGFKDANLTMNEEVVANPMEFNNTSLSDNAEVATNSVEFNNINLSPTEQAVVNPMEFNNISLSDNEEVVSNPVEFNDNLESNKEVSEDKNEMSDEVLLKKAVRELIVLGVIIAITIFALPTIYDIVKGNDNFVTDFINNVKGS